MYIVRGRGDAKHSYISPTETHTLTNHDRLDLKLTLQVTILSRQQSCGTGHDGPYTFSDSES